MAKMNREEFVVQAILKLRKGKQKGLSTATANLEKAFQMQYGEKANLLKTAAKMQAAGTLVLRQQKDPHHFTMYLPEEAPAQKRTAEDILSSIGVKVTRTLVKAG